MKKLDFFSKDFEKDLVSKFMDGKFFRVFDNVGLI